MLTIPNPENVYLACGPIDLRKSIDSLAALVQ
ncbi:IS66 family insertion sequence element accessory protein TnpB [Paenibacillus phocaensis]|jgi:transposase|nr:IS66 family insertion sequence element accessory protein TnpB [Paenibacillus phocaensis]